MSLEDLSSYGVSFWRDQLTDRIINQAILNEYEAYRVKSLDMQEVLLKAGYLKTMNACERDYDFICRYFHGLNKEKVKKTFEVTN